MEKNEIIAQMNSIFCKVFNRDDIKIDRTTNAKDIDDWNSLNHLTLITEIEKSFDIKFTLKEILKFKNVGDTVDCVYEKIKMNS